MENAVKIVVFHVEVPPLEFTMNQKIHSRPIIFNVGTEYENSWKLGFRFHDRLKKEKDKFGISLTLIFKSGKIPSNVDFKISIVRHDNEDLNESLKFQKCYTLDEKKYNVNKPTSFQNLFSYDDLYNNPEVYFPDGKLRILMKIITIQQPAVESTELNLSYQNMLTNELFTDLVIKTSDDSELKAHKSILCTRSEVFATMFSNPMKESESGVLKIDDEEAVVKELLSYIYCNKVGDIKKFDIKLFDAAERYQLDGLKALCLHSIYRRLDPENVIEMAHFAKKYNLDLLLKDCIVIIYAEFGRISTKPAWTHLTHDEKTFFYNSIIKSVPTTDFF